MKFGMMGTNLDLAYYIEIDLDWLRAFQGFLFCGGYPVPNEPIIQPITHLTHVIPLQRFRHFLCTHKNA
jgi:hypothetical protein